MSAMVRACGGLPAVATRISRVTFFALAGSVSMDSTVGAALRWVTPYSSMAW